MRFTHDTVASRKSTLTSNNDRLRKAIERNREKQKKRTIKDSRRGSIVTTRKTVATHTKSDFLNPLRKSRKKAPASVSYLARNINNLNPASKKPTKIRSILITTAWIFCAFLLIRLIFAKRGVMAFHSNKSHYLSKTAKHRTIIKDNNDLKKEIKLIKSSGKYQRKLVRDHLGFIAQDEFLILFPEENEENSI